MEFSQSQVFQALNLPQPSHVDDVLTLPEPTDDLNNPEDLNRTNVLELFQSGLYQPLHVSSFPQEDEILVPSPPAGLQNNTGDPEIPSDSNLQVLFGTSQPELNPSPTDIDSGELHNLLKAGNCAFNYNSEECTGLPHMANDLITASQNTVQDPLAIFDPYFKEIQLPPPLPNLFDYMNNDVTNTMNVASKQTKQNSDTSFGSDTPLATVAKRMHAGKLNEENEKKLKPKKRGRPRGSTKFTAKRPRRYRSEDGPHERARTLARNSTSGNTIDVRNASNTNCIVCDRCGRTYGDEDSFHRHTARSHKPLPNGGQKVRCDNCGIVCRSIANLLRHINHAHNGVLDKCCKLCPATFSSARSLSLHIGREHEGVPEEDGGPRMPRKRLGKEVFECPVCTYSSNQSYNVTRHFKLVHSNAGGFPCPVPGCDRVCKSRTNFQTHMMTCRKRRKT